MAIPPATTDDVLSDLADGAYITQDRHSNGGLGTAWLRRGPIMRQLHKGLVAQMHKRELIKITHDGGGFVRYGLVEGVYAKYA